MTNKKVTFAVSIHDSGNVPRTIRKADPDYNNTGGAPIGKVTNNREGHQLRRDQQGRFPVQ